MNQSNGMNGNGPIADKVKDGIDSYLGFDTTMLFSPKYVDMLAVFGGAVRDIIARDADGIHDIDIVGAPASISQAYMRLMEEGYRKVDLVKPDMQEQYKDTTYIFEPITLMKGQKIVQLIRPSRALVGRASRVRPIDIALDTTNHLVNALKESYLLLLENVDLTTSGLFYDGFRLYESVPFAYTYCRLKYAVKRPSAFLYDEQRTERRMRSLYVKRGYNKKPISIVSRVLKLAKINKNDEIGTMDDYKKKINKTVGEALPRLAI